MEYSDETIKHSNEKRKYLKIARELGYSEELRKKIQESETENEIIRALIGERKRLADKEK